MSKVAFKKGLLANLPSAISEGTFYVTTDERALYLDIDGATRVRIGDFQEFGTLTELQANSNPSTTALYYVTELNCLAKWDGEKYVQINIDTGATGVNVTGAGNALDGVSYDPATRKLTFTKTTVFATSDALDELATRVTTAEGKLDTLNGGKETNGSVAKAISDAIGSNPNEKTVVELIAEAQTAATYDDTALTEKVDTLIGEDTGKSARAISTEEATKAINDFATKVSDDGTVNSFKELVDWVADHGSEAAELTAAITAIQAVLDGIGDDGEKPTVVAYVADAIAALKIGDYAKAADLTALAARVTAAEGKIDTLTGDDTVDGSVAHALKTAKDYADSALEWGEF